MHEGSSCAAQRGALRPRHRLRAPLLRAALCFAHAGFVAAFPTGAGTCNPTGVHNLLGSSGLQLVLPSSYNSSAPPAGLAVELRCTAASCANPSSPSFAGIGFLLVAVNAVGAPVGQFLPLLPSTPGWSQPVCGSGLTHAAPQTVTSFTFSWVPSAGLNGTVTVGAALAIGFPEAYATFGCIMDVAAGGEAYSSETSMAGMQMRRARALLQADPDLVAVATQGACPASGAEAPRHAGESGMQMAMGGMQMQWTAGGVLPMAVMFAGATPDTPGGFTALMFASFGLAWLASEVAAANAAQEKAVTEAPGGGGWRGRARAAAAAGGMAVRTGLHYGCMLLAMTYSVWVLLALAFGHAAAHCSRAVRARRRRVATSAEQGESKGGS